MEKTKICLINDSFPPAIDGVANAVTNYADIITREHGSAAVVTPYYPDADDSVGMYRNRIISARYTYLKERDIFFTTSALPVSDPCRSSS